MNTNYKRYIFKIIASITILTFTPLQILSSSVCGKKDITTKSQYGFINSGNSEKFVTGFIPSNFSPLLADLSSSSQTQLRIEQPDQTIIGLEIKKILGDEGNGYKLQQSAPELPPKVKEAIIKILATMEDMTPKERAEAVLESEVMRRWVGPKIERLRGLLFRISGGKHIDLKKENIASDIAEIIEVTQNKIGVILMKLKDPNISAEEIAKLVIKVFKKIDRESNAEVLIALADLFDKTNEKQVEEKIIRSLRIVNSEYALAIIVEILQKRRYISDQEVKSTLNRMLVKMRMFKDPGYTLSRTAPELPPGLKDALLKIVQSATTPKERARAILESKPMREATGDTANQLNNLLVGIYSGGSVNPEKEGIAGDIAEIIEAVGFNFIMDIPDEELIKQLRAGLNVRQRKYIDRVIKIFDILWDGGRTKTKTSDYYKKLFHNFIIAQTLGSDYGTFYMGKPESQPSNAPTNILEGKGISIPPQLDLLIGDTALKSAGEVFTKISKSKLSAQEQKWVKQGYLYFYIASRIEHNADYLKKKTSGANIEAKPQPYQSFCDSLSLLSEKNRIKPEAYLPVSRLNAMLVNGRSEGYNQIRDIAIEAAQPVNLPQSAREAQIMEIETDLKEKYYNEKEISPQLQDIVANAGLTKDEMVRLFNVGFSMSTYAGLASIFEGRIKFSFNSNEDIITTEALKLVIDKRKPDHSWYNAIKDNISNLARFNEIIKAAKIDLPKESELGYAELRTTPEVPPANIYQNLSPEVKQEIMSKLNELDDTGVVGRRQRAITILDIVEPKKNPNYLLLIAALNEVTRGVFDHFHQLGVAPESDFQEILDRVLLTPQPPPTLEWVKKLISSNCPRATAPNGALYLADTKNNRIIKYWRDSGKFELVTGYTGYGLEKLEAPNSIYFDDTGNLIIFDKNNKITYWPATGRWDREPLSAQSPSEKPGEITTLSPPPTLSSNQEGKLPDFVKIPLINLLNRLPRHYTPAQRAGSVLDSLSSSENKKVLILKEGLEYIAKGGFVDLTTVKDKDIRDILEIVQTRVEDFLPSDVLARQAIEDFGINFWYDYTRSSPTSARKKVIFAPKELFLGPSSQSIIGLREALQMLSLRKMDSDEPEATVVVLCDDSTDSETIKAMGLPGVLTIVDTNFDLTKPIPVQNIKSLLDTKSDTYLRNWENIGGLIASVGGKSNIGIIAKPMESGIIDAITQESEIEGLTKDGISLILLEKPSPENNQFISAFNLFYELAKCFSGQGEAITIIAPISLPAEIYQKIQDYIGRLLALERKA